MAYDKNKIFEQAKVFLTLPFLFNDHSSPLAKT